MKFTQLKISVRDLVIGYKKNADGSAVGYRGKLIISPLRRPLVEEAQQRQQRALIEAVIKGFPLTAMYCFRDTDGSLKLVNSRQRVILICEFVAGVFPLRNRHFKSLTKGEQDRILDYELQLYVGEEATAEEFYNWFRDLNGNSKGSGVRDVLEGGEFYTPMSDIESELRNYAEYFRGKVVCCNCDDPYESNFFKYFILNFNKLGLRKLITTSYAGSSVAGKELKLVEQGVAYKIEVSAISESDCLSLDGVKHFLEGKNTDTKKVEALKGDGDFRSKECVALLKEADIVASNPPPSLIGEYVKQLVRLNKEFLVIGLKETPTHKEIFPLIKENNVWLGVGSMSDGKGVGSPANTANQKGSINKHCCWLTNIDHDRRHEALKLTKIYVPKKYPRYDNYDAIEVDTTADIPKDYDGLMGVPTTFIKKYCPEQFRIVGCSDVNLGDDFFYVNGRPTINGKEAPIRIFIRRYQQPSIKGKAFHVRVSKVGYRKS